MCRLTLTRMSDSLQSISIDDPVKPSSSASLDTYDEGGKKVNLAVYPYNEKSASWISRNLTYSWANPLFQAGNNHELKVSELLPVIPADMPTIVSATFEAHLERLVAAGDPTPVTSAIKAQFWKPFVQAGILKFFNSSSRLMPPIFLNQLLTAIASSSQDPTTVSAKVGWVWVFALFFSLVIGTFIENAYFKAVSRIGWQVRTAITSAVYRKSLRLSPVSRLDTPVGQIVNLMQLDATRLETVTLQLHVIWDGLFQIVSNMVLLGIYIGPSALAGLGSMILLIPLNFMAMTAMGKWRRIIAKENDTRVKITNEVLLGIRAVKFYAWELFFEKRINDVRVKELAGLRGYALQTSVNSTLMMTAPVLVAIVTLTVYAGVGGQFTAARIFTAIAILNQLRFPLMFYPMVISQVADAKVSLERLNKFLKQPEVPDREKAKQTAAASATLLIDTVSTSSPPLPNSLIAASIHAANQLPLDQVGVRVTKGTFYWEEAIAHAERVVRKAEEKACADLKKEKETAKKALDAAKKANSGSVAVAEASKALADVTAREKAKIAADKVLATQPRVPAPLPSPPQLPVLRDIDFTIPKGQLWALVGPVGVGKSALCAALLGELAPAPETSITVKGRVALASQTAWVLNATVKQNITFAGDTHAGGGGMARIGADSSSTGHTCKDEALYLRVVEACCLAPDLAILPAGDATEIGERGINLSGGQKQRVSLARAAYARADVVILDDPLSALDAEVGHAVFDHVISNNGLMAGSTRLLVTNALQYLAQCDGIVLLAPDGGTGRVLAAGHFDELMVGSPAFREMLNSFGHSQTGGNGADGAEVSQAESEVTADAKAIKVVESAAVSAAVVVKPTAGKMMTEEEKKVGQIATAYYFRYLRSGGSLWIIIPLLGFSYIINQLTQLASQWWLTFWSSDITYQRFSMGGYMGIFAALGVAAAIFSFIRVVVMMFVGLAASRRLHAGLLKSVISAPLVFFDTTPVGRLLARFTKDIETIDTALPSTFGMLWMCIFFIIGTVAAIIFAVPYFALIMVPIMIVYWHVMIYFRNVSREVKRYDAITRSPIYAHFSETLGGLPVIRAYGLSAAFGAASEARVADNIAATYTLKTCDRWLSVRLETIGNVVVLSAGLLCYGTIASTRAEGSATGLSGFALSTAMALTGLLNWVVRTSAECEQQMNSVERVTHYLDTIPSEPFDTPLPLGDSLVPRVVAPSPAGWPAHGVLAVDNYRMRYRETTPEVLRGISFSVKAGEKIGIVGRTGSGKSSLIAALFRLIEGKCHSGVISLDGIDIDGIGLRQLRSSLAIIPQEPTVFSGSLRSNLDPTGSLGTGDVADAKLWDALARVGLKEAIERLDGGLLAPIAEFGESLSVGQRQLLCLARVLLRSNRTALIALDEASASLDHVADAALQRVIGESFAHATLLIIAHR